MLKKEVKILINFKFQNLCMFTSSLYIIELENRISKLVNSYKLTDNKLIYSREFTYLYIYIVLSPLLYRLISTFISSYLHFYIVLSPLLYRLISTFINSKSHRPFLLIFQRSLILTKV